MNKRHLKVLLGEGEETSDASVKRLLETQDAEIAMQLETMVPKQLPRPVAEGPGDQGPRLINFLLPSEREGHTATGSGPNESGAGDTTATPRPLGFSKADRMADAQTGLYRKHVEALQWKTSTES